MMRCTFTRGAATWSLAFLLSCVSFGSATAIQYVYHEDFTTKQFCDKLNTSALWDTVATEVRLKDFVLVLEGGCDTPGSAQDVAVDGDLAFVADGTAGLQVLDVTAPKTPFVLGNLPTGGDAFGIDVRGDRAYLADLDQGLVVADISVPAAPVLLGQVATYGTPRDVLVRGNYAFVADYLSGLTIVDVSDPSDPSIVASMTDCPEAYSLDVSGAFVFIADRSQGLKIIDVSNPSAPSLAAQYSTPCEAYGVSVYGDRAYVVGFESSWPEPQAFLEAVSVDDPTHPEFLGRRLSVGYSYEIVVDGVHAYVADAMDGVRQYDVSVPSSPALKSSLPLPPWAVGLELRGPHVFVADSAYGVKVVNVAERTEPYPSGLADTPNAAFGVAAIGDYAYVGDQQSGLQVVDVSDAANPALVGGVALPGRAYGVDVAGDYAYVANAGFGLQIVDISDPESPQHVSGIDSPSFAYDVAVDGSLAYVADGNSGIQVYDVSDPLVPESTGSVDTPGTAYAVCVQGDYVGDRLSGLQVVDISDPQNPFVVGGCGVPYDARGVEVAGDYAFVADAGSGLLVIDISDPSDPIYVGGYGSSGGDDVAISGDRAFLTAGFDGVFAVDISNPGSPTWVGAAPTNDWAYCVVPRGDYLLVATNTAGLQTIQIYQREFDTVKNVVRSIPVRETEFEITSVALTSSQTDSVHWDVSADGGAHWMHIWPDGEEHSIAFPGTLLVWRALLRYDRAVASPACSDLELTCWMEGTGVPEDPYGRSFALHQNSPNPFNPVTTLEYEIPPEVKDASIVVFDASGREVRTLLNGPVREGEGFVVWDGRNDAGLRVASGVYFCRLSAGRLSLTRRMVLLK